MKKVMIAVPFMLIFCLGQLFGQKNMFNIGIEGGTNLTFLHKNTTAFPSNPGFGFAGGVSFQYNFSGRIGIKTGINFERRITKGSLEFTDENGQSLGTTRTNAHFDYMVVPVMGRLTWADKGKFYYINAGPHIGYLLRQINDLGAGYVVNDNLVLVENNTAIFENFDIGISAGVGAMFPINQKLYLTTEVRSNLGLRDMMPNPDNSIKTHSVNLMAGIAYRL